MVDDDIELCQLIGEYLAQENFSVTAIHDGADAAAKINSDKYDLIILDVMLPNKNGFEVLKEINYLKKTPVLMLTAKGDELDRIVGLEMGADDYLAKPCNPRELVARVRSIIRRAEAIPPQLLGAEEQTITLQDVVIEPSKRELTVAGKVLDLTATEYQILLLLMQNHGELVTRETISEQCLGRRLMAYDRSIDMHISHVRKKLGQDQRSNERIKTIRGVGYQYVAI
jgi:two-component system response regulator CpxR